MKKTLKLLFLAICLASSLMAQEKKAKLGKRYPNFIKIEQTINLTQKSSLFNQYFDITSNDELRPTDSFTDELGFKHDKHQQYYKGIKVDGATYTIHSKNGVIASLSGNYRGMFGDVNITPSISEENGFAKALSRVNAKQYAWDDPKSDIKKTKGELVIVVNPKDLKNAQLAYKYDIYATEPLYRAYVYIDAHSGEFIQEIHRIHEADVPASGTSLYNGNVNFTADFTSGVYRLRQTTDGGGVETYNMNNGTNYAAATDFTSTGSNFANSPIGVQAHFGAEQTHKYFLQKHNRNSFDNNGAVLKSYVSYSTGYVNAFWDGSRMTYGDGDGVNYGPLVSLDITGHEIAHGVTEYSANLIYQQESGALNESFSDIFGETIENFAKGTNDWQMGTDIGIGGSGAIRSMNNPNLYGDPDTYQGAYWKDINSPSDYGGVHSNSGVQNKWFYILSVGETGVNDIGIAYNVQGIGIQKAAAIAYRNLSVYLSTYSVYTDARTGAIQSAKDLFGENSTEALATAAAWDAVGVGVAPPPAACVGGNVNLTIKLDNYPEETSWNLRNSNNTIIASGGTYGNLPDGSTVSQNFNLNPGNYKFTILDSYGDGICCLYGTGNYTLKSGGAIIVSGGDFATSESTNFCVNDTIPPTAPILSLGTITQTSVGLSWNASTDNVGVSLYQIFQNGVLKDSTTNLAYTVTNLSPATSYAFTVKAKDAIGNVSNASNVVNATTTAPPTPVRFEAETNFTIVSNVGTNGNIAPANNNIASAGKDLRAYDIGDKFNINFTVPQTGQYRLKVRARSGTIANPTTYWNPLGYSFKVNNTSTTFTPNPSTVSTTATTAYGAVGAHFGNVESGIINLNVGANVLEITMTRTWLGVDYLDVEFLGGNAPDTIPPTAPVLSLGTVTQTSVGLSWTASTDNVGVSHYQIFQNGAFKDSTTNLSYTVTNLSPATSYAFTVKAKDAAGNVSNASNTINATTTAPPAVARFEAETNFTIVSNVGTNGNIAPANNNIASAGKDLRAYDIGDKFNINFTVPQTGQYRLKVRARSGTIANPTTYWNPLGYAFKVDSVNNTFTPNPSTVSTTATTAYGAVGAHFGNVESGIVNLNSGSHTLEITMTRTWLGVDYLDVEFLGGNAPDTLAPTAPVLSLGTITQTSVALTWIASTDNVGVSTYEIFQNNVLVNSTANLNYTATGLNPYTYYTFKVRAKDAAGNASDSSNVVIAITLAPPTSVRFEAETNFTIVSNVGTNGNIVVGNNNIASAGKDLRAYDIGDKFNINFNVTQSGQYRLKVRARSGTIANPTIYWNPLGYAFKVDSVNTTFTPNPSTVSTTATTAYGSVGAHFGNVESGIVNLNSGSHTLEITMTRTWLGVDYLDVEFLGSGVSNQTESEIQVSKTFTLAQDISKIYPNPSNGDVYVEFSGEINGKVEYSILDAQGKVITKQALNIDEPQYVIKIAIANLRLSEGVYYLYVKGDKLLEKTIRFVKN